MDGITTKQFSILSDHMAVYQFMLDIFFPGRPGVQWTYWRK